VTTDNDEHSTRLLSIRARVGFLNADELEAFDVLLAKLEQGKRDHGPLDLNKDGRNFREEGRHELRDWLWYFAFEAIQQRRLPLEPKPTVQFCAFEGEAP
jgi:hypothetical protein